MQDGTSLDDDVELNRALGSVDDELEEESATSGVESRASNQPITAQNSLSDSLYSMLRAYLNIKLEML